MNTEEADRCRPHKPCFAMKLLFEGCHWTSLPTQFAWVLFDCSAGGMDCFLPVLRTSAPEIAGGNMFAHGSLQRC